MEDTNKRPIGVFDSGVGGLSVLIELKKLLPNENFVFVADQKYVPYGEKSKTKLVELTSNITDYFIQTHNIKMMVVACNTATVNAIDELRAKYSLPIVGTVPAIKLAIEKTKTKTVAIISTPSTSKSVSLKKLIKEYSQNIEVINIGCKNLENVVEEGDLYSTRTNNLLLKYLQKIKNSNVDYLVLGCTHYPFLKKAIQKIVGSKIKLLDSGKAIAKRTLSLLKTQDFKNKQKRGGEIIYFTTGDARKFSKVASLLLSEKIDTKRIKI